MVEMSLETQKTDDKDCQYAKCWAVFRGTRDEREWLLDSGASYHIFITGLALQNEYACNLSVPIADGCTIQSSTCGHITMETNVNGKQIKILLQDVHVIPGLRKNVLSIGQLAKKGIHTSFNDKVHHCGSLTTRESNLLLAARRGTIGFATSMGRQSYQLLRVSQQNLMTAS